MNPCNNCIVDMICTQKCPMFKIDLERVQTDDVTYLKRCLKNQNPNKENTYQLAVNIVVMIYRQSINWFKNYRSHRDNDKPAIIWFTGSRHWYKNGKLHRDNDQPAIIWPDGSRFWYKNGRHHRDNDQPVIIYADGSKRWLKKGKLHRDNNQPFIINNN